MRCGRIPRLLRLSVTAPEGQEIHDAAESTSPSAVTPPYSISSNKLPATARAPSHSLSRFTDVAPSFGSGGQPLNFPTPSRDGAESRYHTPPASPTMAKAKLDHRGFRRTLNSPPPLKRRKAESVTPTSAVPCLVLPTFGAADGGGEPSEELSNFVSELKATLDQADVRVAGLAL